MPVTAKLGHLLHFQRNVAIHLEIWSKIQQISPTPTPPALLMAAIYHPDLIRRDFGKSVVTLRTCPGRPTAIYHNFFLQLLWRIFEKIKDVFYVVTSKFCSKCKGSTLITHKNHFFTNNFVFSKKLKQNPVE